MFILLGMAGSINCTKSEKKLFIMKKRVAALTAAIALTVGANVTPIAVHAEIIMQKVHR